MQIFKKLHFCIYFEKQYMESLSLLFKINKTKSLLSAKEFFTSTPWKLTVFVDVYHIESPGHGS